MKSGTKIKNLPPFISTPKVIEFIDFEVGKIYKQSITLTNVSSTRNSCKLLELPLEHQDSLTIDFTPQGFISAGISFEFEVTFHPVKNEDIYTEIPGISAKGAFQIPIICKTKRHIVQIPDSLDFQIIPFSQSKKMYLNIRSEGALPLTINISSDHASQNSVIYENEFENEIDSPYELSFVESTNISAYGNANIPILIKPQKPGSLFCTLHIVCSSSLTTTHHNVILSAEGSKLPVYIDRKELDLQVVFFDQTYRDYFQLVNTSKSALKCKMSLPAFFSSKECELMGLSNSIQILPSLGYVQANSSLQIGCKIKVFSSLCELPEFYDGTFIKIPIYIEVANEVVPLKIVLVARPSTNKLVVLSSNDAPIHTINLGEILLNQQRSIPLKIKNEAIVPQEVCLKGPSRICKVYPNDGLMCIRPDQTVETVVQICPAILGSNTRELVLQSLFGFQKTIKITYQCIEPIITCDIQCINFGNVDANQTRSKSVCLINQSKSTQIIELTLPDGPFKVSPSTLEITGKSSRMVEIVFKAIDYEQTKNEAKQLKEEYERALEEWNQKMEYFNEDNIQMDPDTPSKQGNTKKKGGTKNVKSSKVSKSSKSSKISKNTNDSTTLELPEKPVLKIPENYSLDEAIVYSEGLFVTKLGLSVQNHEAYEQYILLQGFTGMKKTILVDSNNEVITQINFGNIPVGKRVTKTFYIKNLYDDDIYPETLPFGIQSGFELVTTPRMIKAGESIRIMFSFQPNYERQYCDFFSFRTHCNEFTVPLIGEGKSPNLEILPENLEHHHFGCCSVNEKLKKTFQIKNLSIFAVQLQCKVKKLLPLPINGISPFLLSITDKYLEPNETVEVIVTFQPSYNQSYQCVLEFDSGSLDYLQTCQLSGNGCFDQLYIDQSEKDPFTEKSKTFFEMQGKINSNLFLKNLEKSQYLNIGNPLSKKIDCFIDNVSLPFVIQNCKFSIESNDYERVEVKLDPSVEFGVLYESEIVIRCNEFKSDSKIHLLAYLQNKEQSF
eukprot:TRINITY_DN1808_c0_g1_i1.p1 TRINITY_DN1808_c0_g1~~TRINITY_DN1808_c0_g1_i1.p1  ORF type:complete len:1019 (+),score=225.95 TRINITY_DN1808_c0_g1_i1:31-3057(+)